MPATPHRAPLHRIPHCARHRDRHVRRPHRPVRARCGALGCGRVDSDRHHGGPGGDRRRVDRDGAGGYAIGGVAAAAAFALAKLLA